MTCNITCSEKSGQNQYIEMLTILLRVYSYTQENKNKKINKIKWTK